MRVTIKTLRRIIRESIDENHQKVHAFNKSLTRMFNEIRDGVIEFETSVEFADNPEVDAALEDIEEAMLRLKKALYEQLGK